MLLISLEQSTQPSTTWLQLASPLSPQRCSTAGSQFLWSTGLPPTSGPLHRSSFCFCFPFHIFIACSSCRSQLKYHLLREAFSHATDELKFLARSYIPALCGFFSPIKLITTIITYLFNYLTNVLAASVVCKPHEGGSVCFAMLPSFLILAHPVFRMACSSSPFPL